MKSKLFFYITICYVIAVVVSSCKQVDAANFKVATVAPRGTSFHNHLEELNAEWSQAPGERVRMNIYAGTQGGEVAIVKRMRVLSGAPVSTAMGSWLLL